MSNSVDNITSNSLLSSTEQTSRVKETAGKPDRDVDEARSQTQGTHQRPTDEVVLTESARRLQNIESELQNVPVVDQAKVDSVKERIATDNFQINAENIAEKVLATDKLLG
jgi:negative regulator of flagellin synthesis FlgM